MEILLAIIIAVLIYVLYTMHKQAEWSEMTDEVVGTFMKLVMDGRIVLAPPSKKRGRPRKGVVE